jgi:tRNA (cmo5U34)-methyltransferase
MSELAAGESSTGWEEEDSQFFIGLGHVMVPARWEQISTIASLVPAKPDEAFLAVDLACGAGVLSGLILHRFPASSVVALDGSAAMLAHACASLGDIGSRASFRRFDLRKRDWLEALPPVRCFVSSLAIHHLDGPEKRDLFAALRERLEPGGALLIADLILPANDRARALYAGTYDALVRDQSIAFTRSVDAYRRFHEEDWNYFVTPDVDFDKPSRVFDQLVWLREAGFVDVDCFWLRAGHAVYGGFKGLA